MKGIIHKIIFLTILAFFIIPMNIYACMIIFYKSDPLIYEISHRAMIIYDSENQKVGLIPQISFKGRPQDFAVIVPTPSVPKLNSVSSTIFYDVEYLTSPIVRWREEGFGCSYVAGTAEESSNRVDYNEISIINEKTIGAFDTVTLSASDPDALTKWLKENGYRFSSNDKSILDYYIQKGWVFTAMKFNEPALMDTPCNINPIIFRYSASSLIYPIRLMSINTEDSTSLVIYILSNSKMTFPNAIVEYANNIDDNELKEIEKNYPAFAGLIGQNRYLTKLKRTFSIMEMDSDVEITKSPNNKEFKGIIYYDILPLKDIIPFAIAILTLLVIRYIIIRKKIAI
ncbi:MAG: DUF2330 domain-containing protein [Candidatus Poribacteria bacterium]